MTFARAIRLLLALASALIVVWAFVDVGARIIRGGAHGRRVTLTILHWGDKDETGIMQALVDDFEREHPDIRIQRIHAPNADYDAKLKTMFASGEPPDLFYMGYENFSNFMALDLLQSIEPYLEKERATGRAGWLDDFYPILLDSFRWDGAKAGAGPLYGLPKDFSTAVMYVNKDLFRQAGVEIPYGGWSWEQFEDIARRITALSQTEDRRIYGAVFETWPLMLREILWTYGGEFFGPGGFSDVWLDSPGSLQAMEMIRRMRLVEGTAYNPTGVAKEGGQEFFTGNIGIHGPVGRWRTPRYRDIPQKRGPDDTNPAHFDWDVVPIPYGTEKVAPLFTVAWSMSKHAKHPDESFQLMKYLCGPKGQALAAELGLAIPSLKSVARSPAFLDPAKKPANTQAFLDAIELLRMGQIPSQPEFLRYVQEETESALALGLKTPAEAAQAVERRWKAELATPLKTRTYPPIRWDIIGTIALASLALLASLLWWKARGETIGALDRQAERAGWLFIAPWVIGFILLTLGPMIVSLLLSFSRWTAMTPFGEAQFVGLDNYRYALSQQTFYNSLKVTVWYVLLAVPLGQVAALAVALLMNAKVRAITVFRTIYFVPSVISGVALATLWLWIFNKDYGLMNALLRPIATRLGFSPPDWFGADAGTWAIPAFVMMGLWGVGGGMIIYLAGLKGIPASLYEAATVDGAGPLRKLWNVTLPMLSPLIFYNLVMGIIGSFQIFTQAKVMTNGGPGDKTLFYVLYLFREAFEFHNMGFASALAWVLFVLILILTILVFRGSRNLVYYEGLKT